MAKRGHNRKKGMGTAAGIRAFVDAHRIVLSDDDKEREEQKREIATYSKGAKKTPEELERDRQLCTRAIPRKRRGIDRKQAIREQL